MGDGNESTFGVNMSEKNKNQRKVYFDMEKEQRAVSSVEKRKRRYLVQKRKQQKQKKHFLCCLVILVSLLVSGISIYSVFSAAKEEETIQQQKKKEIEASVESENKEEVLELKEELPVFEIPVQEALLTPNEYSRPQIPLEPVTGVVIHYVGNANTKGISNRNFFESLKDSHETSVSSHFVIGLEGEIILCVPLDEVAYANRGRNSDTISIECCHPNTEGKFNEATYQSLVQLVSYLVLTYELEEEDILRHYDVTGKECPLYYVKKEDAWENLKSDIMEETKLHPNSILVME